MIKPIEQQVQVSDDALRFIRAMIAAAIWSEDVLVSVLEKPWHWDGEWTLWNEYDQPVPGEPKFQDMLNDQRFYEVSA